MGSEKEQKSDEKNKKVLKSKAMAKKEKAKWVWPAKIFVLSVALSLVFSIGSEFFMSSTGIILSSLTIIVLIVVAVICDMIGVAATASSSEPFTSMASRKVKGAKEALILIKNADKISSICNDVLGDICGILSGAAGASIVVRITETMTSNAGRILVSSLVSAFIAGFTILGKAVLKNYAIEKADNIILTVGKILSPVIKKDNNKNN